MSHRISFKSEIKDHDLTVGALELLKYNYRKDSATKFTILDGPLRNATINLETGEVIGDTDWHNRDVLGGLRQAYSEVEIRRTLQRQGATIESRTVKNGEVKILCRITA